VSEYFLFSIFLYISTVWRIFWVKYVTVYFILLSSLTWTIKSMHYSPKNIKNDIWCLNNFWFDCILTDRHSALDVEVVDTQIDGIH